jgi:hypothetical protein
MNAKARRAAAAALAASALLLPMSAMADTTGCKVGSVTMPVKMVGSRAVATVGINGTQVPTPSTTSPTA